MKYLATIIFLVCTCYAELTEQQIALLVIENEIEKFEKEHANLDKMSTDIDYLGKTAIMVDKEYKTMLNGARLVVPSELKGYDSGKLVEEYIRQKAIAYMLAYGVCYNKLIIPSRYGAGQLQECYDIYKKADENIHKAKALHALPPHFKYAEYLKRKNGKSDKKNKIDKQSKEKQDLDRKVAKVNKQLSKRITITLTKNPKNKPLTLDYAVYKVCKMVGVKYLHKLSRLNCPNITKIKLDRFVARNKKASYIIGLYLSANSMEYVINSEGLYIRKK